MYIFIFLHKCTENDNFLYGKRGLNPRNTSAASYEHPLREPNKKAGIEPRQAASGLHFDTLAKASGRSTALLSQGVASCEYPLRSPHKKIRGKNLGFFYGVSEGD